METLVDEYRRLYSHMMELNKARCFCMQAGLDHVLPEKTVKRYKTLGIYNPDMKTPDFALGNMHELELQMVETTSQLRLLYNLIEKEDEDSAERLQDLSKVIDATHSQLEASLIYTLRQSVGYDKE